MLTLLAYNQWEGTVQGINDLQAQYAAEYGPGNYVPPVAISYWSFRIMVGAGFLLLAFAFYALFLVMGDNLETRSRLFALFPWLIFLPYIANTFGWLLTELGRAPWVVFGLMKIEDAVSPNVTSGMLGLSLVGFTLVYGSLMAADIFLLRKYARAGVAGGELISAPEEEGIPSLAGD
jgi:cytochrome d ubiquinol oxidase subunit I